MAANKTPKTSALSTIPDLPDTPEQGWFRFPNCLIPKLRMIGESLPTYTVLLYHARRTGKCHPKVATLALETGRDARTVRRDIHKLKKIGLIKKSKQAGRYSVYYLVDFLDYPL